MKYIDAEKLEAALALHYTEITIPVITDEGGVESYIRRKEIYAIKKIIDSLTHEQPDNEDIDKVAQELYEHLYELKRRNNVPTNLYDKQEIIDLWKAGIVYGRSHPKQEQPEVDLEKEIEWEWVHREKQEVDLIECAEMDKEAFVAFARHFYELGLKARKEK